MPDDWTELVETTSADHTPGRPVVYLWAAFGGPSASPGRLEICVCTRCGCLLAATTKAPHEGWHARREDR